MHLASAAGTGIGLRELCEFGSVNDSSKLTAVSVRGRVGAGTNVLRVGPGVHPTFPRINRARVEPSSGSLHGLDCDGA